MSWAMTEDVAILTRRAAGTDRLGETVWEWDREVVGGCLVRQLDGGEARSGDEAAGLRPDGARARFRIALPASWGGAAASLRHARVILLRPERAMDPDDADAALAVTGEPTFTPLPGGFPFGGVLVEVGEFRG